MKPQIRIFKNLEDLSQDAARIFVDLSERSIDERGRFLVAINGGGTPKRLFQLLGTDFRERIDWDRTHIFWGDERLVPTSDPENSYAQARDLFLRHVSIPDANVHRVQTELAPEEAAKNYADILNQFADPSLGSLRFDLIYLGMGEDGHTASLFPGSPVDETEPVMPVTGDYQGRPAQRVTLTPIVINNARTVAFMATGEKKADTLAQVLSGRYQPELYPAQRIEPKDGKLIWLVDEDAASKLPMDLVRRFCEG